MNHPLSSSSVEFGVAVLQEEFASSPLVVVAASKLPVWPFASATIPLSVCHTRLDTENIISPFADGMIEVAATFAAVVTPAPDVAWPVVCVSNGDV